MLLFLFCLYFTLSKNHALWRKMPKYLKIDIDMKSSNCLKTRIIFKNAAWAEMRNCFKIGIFSKMKTRMTKN